LGGIEQKKRTVHQQAIKNRDLTLSTTKRHKAPAIEVTVTPGVQFGRGKALSGIPSRWELIADMIPATTTKGAIEVPFQKKDQA